MSVRRPVGAALALGLLSLGGLFLHLRLHPLPVDPADPRNPANVLPAVFGVVSAIAVPAMLFFKRTWLAGYLINGMSVVVGTITMAHLSIAHPPPGGAGALLLRSMIPNILILFAKLPVGQSALRHWRPDGTGRMFTTAWWLRHFAYLGAAYALGFFLWR
ncbi:MAG: hypothetical protein JW876_11640 [Candidatus Krumholzibacteriota bacterium]|nr:hypothetical protein [Candidatus Krumholzibacteriota bacterium]